MMGRRCVIRSIRKLLEMHQWEMSREKNSTERMYNLALRFGLGWVQLEV
jgi:hypothetical protein